MQVWVHQRRLLVSLIAIVLVGCNAVLEVNGAAPRSSPAPSASPNPSALPDPLAGSVTSTPMPTDSKSPTPTPTPTPTPSPLITPTPGVDPSKIETTFLRNAAAVGPSVVLNSKAVPSDWRFSIKVENKNQVAVNNLTWDIDGQYFTVPLKSSLAPGEVFQADFSVELTPQNLTRTLALRLNSQSIATFNVTVTSPRLPLIWLDAADLSTLFSDRACTAAVSTQNPLVACWRNKGSVALEVKSSTEVLGPEWSATSAFDGAPAIRFLHLRPLITTTVVREDVGPVHSFITFARPFAGTNHVWQRVISFANNAGDCATNDNDPPCFAVVATAGSSGEPIVAAPRILETHVTTPRKLVNFSVGRNNYFNSEYLEAEVNQALIFGDALDHEESLAIRARLKRLIKSDKLTLNPTNYDD